MDAKRSLRWAGSYFGWTLLFAIVGALLALGGVYVAVANATQTAVQGVTVPVPTAASAAGLVLLVLGAAVYRAGKAWALYRTLTGAMEEQLADTYDTEHVKSDIASVVDDRLSDVQHEVQSVKREVRDLKPEKQYVDMNED
ncbi:MAG: hypothetical protein ABEJ80_01030 [Halarchaeum sp.]